MEYIGQLIGIIVKFMKREFAIYGYTMSFWDIMLFALIATILFKFILGFFD